MSLSPSSATPYDQAAERYGLLYAGRRFEEIHCHVLPFLPQRGGCVLDVGAGSGRDAHALAARGYRVTAVEPALALQRWGQGHYGHGDIGWMSDWLPELGGLASESALFDFILCSAVLIHLDPNQLFESFSTLARLLAPNGRLAVSVRDSTDTDIPGIFFEHSDRSLIMAARAASLDLLSVAQNPDLMGRSAVTWRSLIFVKASSRDDGSP